MRRAFLSVALCLAAGCLSASTRGALQPWRGEVRLAEERVLVPMRHATGFLQVDVWIGDAGPFLFQVDTYASGEVFVDEGFAREQGFARVGTTINSDGRNSRERDLVRVPELRLGGATFTGFRTMADDYGMLTKPGEPRVCGLLGFALFRDLLWTIDYPGDRFVLQRGALPRDAPNCLVYESTTGSPDVRLRLGGETLLCGIDTGMTAALALHLDDAKRLGVAGEPRQVGKARTVYTEFDVYEATLAVDVELAGHRIEALPVTCFDPPSRRLLGQALLEPYAVTFDQRARRVQFLLPEPLAPRE